MKKLIAICLIGLVLPLTAEGQTNVYYYGINSRPVKSMSDAITYDEVRKKSESKYIIKTHQLTEGHWKQVKKEKVKLTGNNTQTIHYNANTWFPKKIFREYETVGPTEYLFKESSINNLIRTGSSSSYLPLHLEGLVTLYHPNGEIKSKSIYKENQLVSNENWQSNGTKYIDSVFYSVDQEPEYQMGDEFFKSFLIKKLKQSKLDLTQIQDEVVIGWVIMETGTMDGIIATKGKSRQLNEFLINIIAELPGTWTTAKLNGVTVRYYMSIPLNFLTRDASFQEIDFSPGGVMHYNKY